MYLPFVRYGEGGTCLGYTGVPHHYTLHHTCTVLLADILTRKPSQQHVSDMSTGDVWVSSVPVILFSAVIKGSRKAYL